MNLPEKRTIRLRGRSILAIGISRGIKSIQEISNRSGRNYRSIHTWLRKPKSITVVDLDMLVDILEAIGIPIDELMEMQIKDIFEIQEIEG